MARSNIFAFVLAGGEGSRLRPLTEHHCKPALDFAHGHRIIDFVLGNLINSKVGTIRILAQYKPDSLIDHIEEVWSGLARAAGCRIDLVVTSEHAQGAKFRGTAHAVHVCIDAMRRAAPDIVAVFAADHVYRMDVRQMARFHRRRNAEVTVATHSVPISDACAFGVMATDASGRISRFQEKPRHPESIPGNPERAYVSMGNYMFRPQTLERLLEQAAERGDSDFGAHILPRLPAHGAAVFAYDFACNIVPGTQPYEEQAYWRDVGTLGTLARARADVEGEFPRFDLRNRDWPIRPDLQPMLSELRAAHRLGIAA